MKNLLLIIMVVAIAYSCATIKTHDEKTMDSNRIAQERITILKEAESSSNPAILQQAELIKAQIQKETERHQWEKWADKNQWWILIGSIMTCSFFLVGFNFLVRLKEGNQRMPKQHINNPSPVTIDELKHIQHLNGITEQHPLAPYIKVMPDGHCAMLTPLMYTTALCLGPTEQVAYRFRFCFPDMQDAIRAFYEVQSVDWVSPYGWCAARPEGRLMQEKHFISCVATQRQEVHTALCCKHFMNIADAVRSSAYCKSAFMTYVGAREIGTPSLCQTSYLFIRYCSGQQIETRMILKEQADAWLSERASGKETAFYEPHLYRLWDITGGGLAGVADFFNRLPEHFEESTFLQVLAERDSAA